MLDLVTREGTECSVVNAASRVCDTIKDRARPPVELDY